MDYNILFLDVDGTLKQEPHPISEANKAAILKACKLGKKITIASGRNKDMILPLVKELRLDEFGEAYTISLNGTLIIENTSGKTMQTAKLPLDFTKRLFDKANEHNISGHLYTENYLYFNEYNKLFEWYQEQGCQCKLVDLTKEGLGLEETPLKFFMAAIDTDTRILEKVEEELRPYTKGIANGEYSTPYSIEYTSADASKGLALKKICDIFNFPIETSIAAGDAENDLSMIEAAGLGIAMKNALPSVKEIADTITVRTCLEDGVTEIIEEHLLS